MQNLQKMLLNQKKNYKTSLLFLRPFLIGNEHERSHEHSKHRCFLIDLASTSWCLDFAPTVFTAVFGSKSRHPKRSRIWQDGGTQIHARRRKHAENGSGSIYVWEQGKRNKQVERKKTLILAACVLGYVENTEERCRKHREIYLGTQLVNCRCTHTHTHTHTYILSLMTDSRHSTPERGSKNVMCTVFDTAVTLLSAGCHTLCALSRGPRAP